MEYEIERQAEDMLKDALRDLKLRCVSTPMKKTELNYSGNPDIRYRIDDGLRQIDGLIAKIQEEDRECDEYLQNYCPNFYLGKLPHSSFDLTTDAETKEAEDAKRRIEQAVEGIDAYAKNRSTKLANSFFDGLKRRYDDFARYGIGRPWGTELRQRMAVAIGLKQEVNSLWELGLNSIANSKDVYLGDHFIDLIKQDGAMDAVREEVNKKVIDDIKFHARRVPYLTPQRLDGQISSVKKCEFGGPRHADNMFEQLKFTLRHPIESQTKYADTWNVAMEELTWAIRHGYVHFDGTYRAAYNVIGFAYIWDMRFSITDTLDLRPHSDRKLSFKDEYNIVTSILGSVYHDLLGNTDNLKVHVAWEESSGDNDKIHRW